MKYIYSKIEYFFGDGFVPSAGGQNKRETITTDVQDFLDLTTFDLAQPVKVQPCFYRN